MAQPPHHLDTNQSIDVQKEQVEESHEKQLLPPFVRGGQDYEPLSLASDNRASLDISQEFPCRERGCVDEELDGSEHGQAPEGHRDVEIVVDLTLLFSETAGNLQ